MTEQRAVVYDETGDPEVLRIAKVPIPTPGEGRARLAVRAVGLNPYDAKVRAGIAPRESPFPRGIGTDVAGIVEEVGTDARYADGTPIRIGDRVFGWGLNTLRERLVVRGSSVTRVPEGLHLEVAGALTTPALAAEASWRAVSVSPGDTVLVSPASGAVGFLLAQRAVAAGARVIGTTSARHADRLRASGIIPIPYGPEFAAALRETLAGGRLDSVFDATGRDVLVHLVGDGSTSPVAPEKVVTLAGEDVAADFGVHAADTSVRETSTLAAIATEVADGRILYPIGETFPLDRVVDAFTALATRSHSGKIVVTSAH